jgi:phospholipid/cholesterol/gamma-HCH transport system permease protein
VSAAAPSTDAAERRPPLLLRALAAPVDFVLDGLESIGSMILIGGRVLAWAARPPYRWTQLLAAMDFVGVQSFFIITLTGAFTGMVFSLQLVAALRRYSGDSMVGGVVAYALSQELSPVFAGLMVTSRAGSAMAAELGNMRVTEQIDAIATMGVSPVQYLIVPRVIATTIMLPLLCMLFTTIGMVGAYAIAVLWLGVDPGIFYDRIETFVEPRNVSVGLFKAAIFGFLIALISCKQGFFATGGAKGVGLATTRAVVYSAVSILVANYIVTMWMTDLG